jgi:hypothetical protein
MQPLPHDGWKSRTYLTTLGLLLLVLLVATVCLFWPSDAPKCTFVEYTGFVQGPVVWILGLGLGKAGWDKHEQRKAGQ